MNIFGYTISSDVQIISKGTLLYYIIVINGTIYKLPFLQICTNGTLTICVNS